MATSEQLEREVDRTRGRIEETLVDLRERLSPALLLDDILDYAQARNLAQLGKQASGNPLPLALVGAGLAWLMLAPNRSSVGARPHNSFTAWTGRIRNMTNYDSERPSDRGESTSNGLYGRASETVGGARDKASDLVDKARETTSGAYQKVSRSMSSAMDTVSSKMPDTRGIANFVQEEPMVLAGIGIALGAVIGALLPATEIEERYIGPTAGSLKEQAKDAAREQWERGKEMAAESWDEAKDAARRTWEDAKDEAQQSWDKQQRMASDAGARGQTGDMTGSQTPLVPSENGERERMTEAASRRGS